MIKIVVIFSFLFSTQWTIANDYLRSDVQVLVCTVKDKAYAGVFLRLNWEDFEATDKTLNAKNKDVTLTVRPELDHTRRETTYMASYQFQFSEKGVNTVGGGGSFRIRQEHAQPDFGQRLDYIRVRYIDRAAPDSEVPRICSTL